MDRKAAIAVVEAELTALRRKRYSELRELLHKELNKTVTGPDGKQYQLETVIVWDGKPEGDLRVMCSVDDGGIRAFFPLTRDFIIASNGTFVGE